MADSQRQGTVALGADDDVDPEREAPRVTAHTTCPDRVVFTENGNSDGWIATDLAVQTRR